MGRSSLSEVFGKGFPPVSCTLPGMVRAPARVAAQEQDKHREWQRAKILASWACLRAVELTNPGAVTLTRRVECLQFWFPVAKSS